MDTGLRGFYRITLAAVLVCTWMGVAHAQTRAVAGEGMGYAEHVLAPGGTLRVVYLAGNPAQAVRESKTGEISGVSVDLARELARQFSVPLEMTGLAGVLDVIDAVREHESQGSAYDNAVEESFFSN